MKRMAALLAVASLVAATVPATAGATRASRTACGGQHYIPMTHIPFPLC